MCPKYQLAFEPAERVAAACARGLVGVALRGGSRGRGRQGLVSAQRAAA